MSLPAAYLYLLLAIIGEVVATSALKASDGFTETIPSTLVVVGYGVAFYFLSLTLKTLPLGITYAVWSGVGIVAVSIFGWLYYKQPLDFAAITGMGMILAGVLVIHLFSKSATIH
ncbi:multidrug efflux SMR transporter [Maritalea porphyrae]|jgi:small multidrug resistance pump|uniref:DMT family transporter n=1 Tax=Maritalea porphyrae TaxID=880732 RepID=UPI0022AFF11B|nr:multidrug efflux SMR transporter [Maritalea porphyrae]MCZ4273573.1 multidrug efflux SMR transporter [Maritalea porphyrae]